MDTVVDAIRVGAHTIALERPRDPEALIDERAFARDEFLPYWAALWPSALALADEVDRLQPSQRSVVELGCGLGLPSLVAAAAGARVTALDWSAEAIALLRANAARNGLAVTGTVADWRDAEPAGGRRFDLVLAADVLYEERNAAPLAALLPRLMALDGVVLLADPGRRHASGFLDAAGPSGWEIASRPDGRIPGGAVHTLRRAEAAG